MSSSKKKALDVLLGNTFPQNQQQQQKENPAKSQGRPDKVTSKRCIAFVWKCHEVVEIIRQTVAKRYLCIPGTSVPAELHFLFQLWIQRVHRVHTQIFLEKKEDEKWVALDPLLNTSAVDYNVFCFII